MALLPDPLLELLRRIFGVQRAGALAAKARLKSVLDADRRAIREAMLAAQAEAAGGVVLEPDAFTEPIEGTPVVTRRRRFVEPPPPAVEEPEWGIYTLNAGPLAGQDRRAIRMPRAAEDAPDLEPWTVIELHEADRWHRGAFPHGLQTPEGIRQDRYLALRCPVGDGPGCWRRE